MYLVDTNILSAAAPTKSKPAHGLAEWMERNSDDLYLSVITIAEIEAGISKLSDNGNDLKAGRLTAWLETVLHLYGSRVLSVDISAARAIGHMTQAMRRAGYNPELADLVIAATAHVNGYTVLTRNIRHFQMLEVRVCDPYVALPKVVRSI